MRPVRLPTQPSSHIATAEGDKVRANHDLEKAAEAEEAAADRFHEAQDKHFGET